MNIQQLNNELGNVDIYLLDQILKGNVSKDMTILDAGCGEGRNLIYFLNNDYHVHGIDQNPDAIKMLNFIIGSKYPACPKSNFEIGELSKLPHADQSFQYIICSAVLHFAKSTEHFEEMFEELYRVTDTNGTLFIRMASNIGLSGQEPIGNGNYSLPDGSTRFLLTKKIYAGLLEKYSFSEIEPLKTVVVDQQRSMSTLILRKNHG